MSRGKNSRDSKEFKKLGINNYTIKVGNIIDEEEENLNMDSIRKMREDKSEAQTDQEIKDDEPSLEMNTDHSPGMRKSMSHRKEDSPQGPNELSERKHN